MTRMFNICFIQADHVDNKIGYADWIKDDSEMEKYMAAVSKKGMNNNPL